MGNQELLQKFARGKKPEQITTGLNAVIYTRVSSKEQAENNNSLDTQKKFCNEYALKSNLTVLSYFGGTYESAQTDERKEFERMIRFVKNQREKVSKIIVYSLDRFSRSGGNAIYISSELLKLGIQIFAVTQPIDTTTNAGVLQQDIHFVFSKFDNDQRREKCVTGMREKLLRGEWMGACPIGYKYEKPLKSKDQRVIISEDGPLIRKAFLWRAKDNVSHTAIAEKLNALGLKITRKRLSGIFRNPFYCGYISNKHLGGEIVKGIHEPIISEEIFLQVNDMLKKNSQGYKCAKENPNIPLKHFVKCAICDSFYAGYIVKKKKLWYYKCAKIGCKCNRNADVMHKKFEQIMSEFTVAENYIEALRKQMEYTFFNLTDSNSDEKRVLTGKLNDVNDKLNKVEERFAYGDIERDVYIKFSEKLRVEKSNLECEIQSHSQNFSNHKELINYTLNFCVKLGESWGKGELFQRTALQNLVFPLGIQYDRRNDTFRTDRVANIFRKINSFPSDYENNKSGKLDWVSNYSASVARRGIEPLLPG